MLTKDKFVKAVGRTVEFEVPEWGDKCKIRAISGAERTELGLLVDSVREGTVQPHEYLGKCVTLFIANENGTRMFEASEWETLTHVEYRILEAIVDAGMDFNGLRKDAVADAEKNSETTTRNDSGSTSQPT